VGRESLIISTESSEKVGVSAISRVGIAHCVGRAAQQVAGADRAIEVRLEEGRREVEKNVKGQGKPRRLGWKGSLVVGA
jgi:hypothetical protein